MAKGEFSVGGDVQGAMPSPTPTPKGKAADPVEHSPKPVKKTAATKKK